MDKELELALFGKKKTEERRFGELVSWEAGGNRALLRGDAGSVEVSALGPHVLRLRSGRDGVFAEDRSFAIEDIPAPSEAPVMSEGQGRVEVSFNGMTLRALEKPMLMSVYDSDDVLLFRDHEGNSLAWAGEGVKLTHLAEPNARYYGFGEKTGPLNKRGRSMEMWSNDMMYHTEYDPLYMSIPFMIVLRSGRAHGMFFDNPGRSSFKVGSDHPWIFEYGASSGELDLYVIEGPSIREVVGRYTELTGRIPMPPRYALGHQQCRWSYMNEDEVRDIARNFRERDIPTDVIYLDIHYMDRYRVFTFDETRFPGMKKMAADLNEQGFRLAVAVDPGVAAADDYGVYKEGRENGYFCKTSAGREFNCHVWPGKVAMPDFSKPETRTWWGGLHKTLLDAGIEGIWNDMNEPSCWNGSARLADLVIPFTPNKDPDIVHDDGGRNTPHRAMRNVFALQECQGTREGLETLRPGSRPFIISRSGYAGLQKYAATWTGDNSSTWKHLALTVPMLLNLGLSGIGFCGPDIGGFMLNCSPELYARWIELGSFYPYCRTHTMIRTKRQEPWSFGEKVESIAREYIKLRYRLHPTMYSLMHECAATGAPVLRPLAYEFQEDRPSDEIDDQLMFGEHLLLAPVVEKGRSSRDVYLPPGTWTDFWTGERLRGPATIRREAPLDLLPIYVRGGGVLFMWPPLDWLEQRDPRRITVLAYPGGRSTSTALIEDDGISEDYRDGKLCRRAFNLSDDGGAAILGIEAAEGDYVPPDREFVIKVKVGARPGQVVLDGREVAVGEDGGPCSYSITESVVRVALADDGGAHELAVPPALD